MAQHIDLISGIISELIKRCSEAEEFELQTEEIESVRWMDYAQVRGMVASDTLPNCIIMEELDLIERHFL